MANFSGNINLLAMKGAKVFSGLDAAHPHLNYVCIPCSYNDIELSSDGKYANVGIYMQETNEKFRQACLQRRQMSGDDMTGYTPPSHQAEVSFSRDFRERALESAKRRIIGEHPEWQSNPNMLNPDYNEELKNAMYNAVRIRLGSFYARIRQQQSSAPMTAQAISGQPTEWSPVADEHVAAASYDDDLPF